MSRQSFFHDSEYQVSDMADALVRGEELECPAAWAKLYRRHGIKCAAYRCDMSQAWYEAMQEGDFENAVHGLWDALARKDMNELKAVADRLAYAYAEEIAEQWADQDVSEGERLSYEAELRAEDARERAMDMRAAA